MIYDEKAHAEKIAANRARRLAEKHGTLTAYSYYGCRCERCTLANARYKAELRAKRQAANAAEQAQRLRLVEETKRRENERKIW